MQLTPPTSEDAAAPQPRRPAISKSLRFAVLKRDSFTCQYCGRRAPEVILHCDHVRAVSEGGTTDILNLVTACSDCNLGKGARNLSDHAVLSKQMNQLAALQEKREQVEMMLAWRDELNQLDDITLEGLVARWDSYTPGYRLTESGIMSVRKLMKRHSAEAVAAAMKIAADQYIEREEDGSVSSESVDKAFNYIGRVATVERAERREPGSRRMFWIRGILRNRLDGRYYNHVKALTVIREAARSGVDLDLIEEAARHATSWSSFLSGVESAAEECADPSRQTALWLAQTRAELAKAFGDDDSQDALELVTTALAYRFSDERLLEIANGCRDWRKFRDWLMESIECRRGLLAPLDHALGSALSEEAAYEVDDALRAGIPPDSIIKSAKKLRSWPLLRAWLEIESNKLMDAQLEEMHARNSQLANEGYHDGSAQGLPIH